MAFKFKKAKAQTEYLKKKKTTVIDERQKIFKGYFLTLEASL